MAVSKVIEINGREKEVKVSKQFRDAVAVRDYCKIVRTVHRLARYETKEIGLPKAKLFWDYAVNHIPVNEIVEGVNGLEEEAYMTHIRQLVINNVELSASYGHDDDEQEESLSLSDRFEAMEDLVECVAAGYSNGLFIAGPGGTGKTWTVMETVNSLGLQEDVDYVVVKGYSTPKGLFNLLRSNRDKLIIFDDCDSIFKDVTGLNILKGVLDTYPVRTVTWSSDRVKEDEETSFSFTGRIIFISNINPEETNNDSFRAVMTRVLGIAVGNSVEEIKDRIISLVPKIADSLNEAEREEVVEFIEKYYRQIRDLSLRFLVHLVGLRLAKPDKWRQLAMALH